MSCGVVCSRFLLVVVFWVVTDFLLTVSSQGSQCTCLNDCGTQGIMSADGRKVNVAYGKSATASSDYTDAGGQSGLACVAVNGRTDTEYRTRSQSSTNCIHTSPTDNNAWWQVDLGQTYTVSNITIYRRYGHATRMRLMRVEVGSSTCHDFGSNTKGLPQKIDITCNPPLTGSYVRLQKYTTDTTDYHTRMINVCEVQVWACSDGTYGKDCANACGQCSGGGVCNKVDGTCPGGCQPGFDSADPLCKTPCSDGTYGKDCANACGQCSSGGVCNKVDGACPGGCQPGFDSAADPLCKTQCPDGEYGKGCANACGQCSGGGVCNKVDGACPGGCQPGFDSAADPPCKTPCSDGTYGKDCANACGQCSSGGVCNKVDGTCPGGCQPGFDSAADPLCKTQCPDGEYGKGCANACGQCSGGGVCNKVDGTCHGGCQPGFDSAADPPCKTPCSDGTYGKDCANACGQCSSGGVCNKVDGTCPGGCQPGFDSADPLCKTRECPDGEYGKGCANACGQCSSGGVCNKVDGACPGGCQPGFDSADPLCKTQCPDGVYGNNCANACGQCSGDGVCNKVDGTCPGGCQPGFDSAADPLCKTQEQTPDAGSGYYSSSGFLGPLVGAVLGGFALIALALVAGALILRSRRQDRPNDRETPAVVDMADIGIPHPEPEPYQNEQDTTDRETDGFYIDPAGEEGNPYDCLDYLDMSGNNDNTAYKPFNMKGAKAATSDDVVYQNTSRF